MTDGLAGDHSEGPRGVRIASERDVAVSALRKIAEQPHRNAQIIAEVALAAIDRSAAGKSTLLSAPQDA